MQYVIFKEFGKYKITSKTNYDEYVRNDSKVLTLPADTFEDALLCAINNGFQPHTILNFTEDDNEIR